MIRSKRSLARQAAFIALLEEHQAAAADYDHDCEEDIRHYVDGQKACQRFVAVTMNYSSSGGKPFFYPEFRSLEVAVSRATEYADDDTFEEVPLEVRDLDTGARWRPCWDNVPFTSGPSIAAVNVETGSFEVRAS